MFTIYVYAPPAIVDHPYLLAPPPARPPSSSGPSTPPKASSLQTYFFPYPLSIRQRVRALVRCRTASRACRRASLTAPINQPPWMTSVISHGAERSGLIGRTPSHKEAADDVEVCAVKWRRGKGVEEGSGAKW